MLDTHVCPPRGRLDGVVGDARKRLEPAWVANREPLHRAAPGIVHEAECGQCTRRTPVKLSAMTGGYTYPAGWVLATVYTATVELAAFCSWFCLARCARSRTAGLPAPAAA